MFYRIWRFLQYQAWVVIPTLAIVAALIVCALPNEPNSPAISPLARTEAILIMLTLFLIAWQVSQASQRSKLSLEFDDYKHCVHIALDPSKPETQVSLQLYVRNRGTRTSSGCSIEYLLDPTKAIPIGTWTPLPPDDRDYPNYPVVGLGVDGVAYPDFAHATRGKMEFSVKNTTTAGSLVIPYRVLDDFASHPYGRRYNKLRLEWDAPGSTAAAAGRPTPSPLKLPHWVFPTGALVIGMLGAIMLAYAFSAGSSGFSMTTGNDLSKPSHERFVAMCDRDTLIFRYSPSNGTTSGGPCPPGKTNPIAIVKSENTWLFRVGIVLTVFATLWQALLAIRSRNLQY